MTELLQRGHALHAAWRSFATAGLCKRCHVHARHSRNMPCLLLPNWEGTGAVAAYLHECKTSGQVAGHAQGRVLPCTGAVTLHRQVLQRRERAFEVVHMQARADDEALTHLVEICSLLRRVPGKRLSAYAVPQQARPHWRDWPGRTA